MSKNQVNISLNFKEAIYSLFNTENSIKFTVSNNSINSFFKDRILPKLTAKILASIQKDIEIHVKKYVVQLKSILSKEWEDALGKREYINWEQGYVLTLNDFVTKSLDNYIFGKFNEIKLKHEAAYLKQLHTQIEESYKEKEKQYLGIMEEWFKQEIKEQSTKNIMAKVSNLLKQESGEA